MMDVFRRFVFIVVMLLIVEGIAFAFSLDECIMHISILYALLYGTLKTFIKYEAD